MIAPLRVGDPLYGYCGGYFGDSYWDKRVEAIGADWVVARDDTEHRARLYVGDPERLIEYRTNPDPEED